MNILYRQLSEIAVNEPIFEKRLEFYQTHYYDNIYIVSDDGRYLGFRNYQTEINGKTYDVEPIQYGISTELVFDRFYRTPGVFRIPVVKGEILLGEYYDASMSGQILYKDIEDKALELFPVFGKKIAEVYKNKRLGVIGENIANILSVFPNAEQVNNSKCYDFVIDTKIIPQFKDFIRKKETNVLSPSEVLLPILIDNVIDYFEANEVRFLFVNGIMKKSLEEVSEPEKVRLNMSIEQVLQDSDFVRRFCGRDSLSYKKLCQHKHDLNQFVKVVSNGVCNVLLDKREEGYNIIGGKRFTTEVPINASIKIHMYGPCAVMGLCVADEMTICSILQRLINQEGYSAEVNNHGLAYGNDKLNDLLGMMDEPVRKGDCIIWFSALEKCDLHKLSDRGVPIIDVRECVRGLNDWFLDNPFHCNAQTNFNIASAILQEFKESSHSSSNNARNSMLDFFDVDLHNNPSAVLDSKELKDYMAYIEQFRCDQSVITKGAVVLNANPCTLGHIYLIQEALKQVDFLYVFLVEESTGNLPYMDREYMLKESLKYNRRVRVIRGGSVMTSEKVFPEYFNKSSEPVKSSVVLAHRVFGQVVGPILGVTYRFFGTEANDVVTRTLNESAIEILPEYGIQPIFIERLFICGEYVSAHNVRDLFGNQQYSELAKFVPLPTYKRLLEISHNYNGNNLSLYYKNADYSVLSKIVDGCAMLSISDTDIRKNKRFYPGMFEKYGCDYLNQNWMLKIAHNENQNMSLSSEKFGQILCGQLNVITSEIVPILYNGVSAQLSKNWEKVEGAQFFPLAAYFEELLDREEFEEGVPFKYETFKRILREKCREGFKEVLAVFWKVIIIDYLLCNSRSAGNIGFFDDGVIKLAPIYDNSTCLESIADNRFMSKDFPSLLMEFDLRINSAYYVLKELDEECLVEAMQYAERQLDLYGLYENISTKEDRFLFDVVEYRYLELFK